MGELLVAKGALTPGQVEDILQVQAGSGRPFGELAERLHGVSPRQVEQAWCEQYARTIPALDLDRTRVDRDLLGMFTRRQAWQLKLIPVCREDGSLVVATTRENLPRAVRYLWKQAGEPVTVMLVEAGELRRGLARYYPWPAMMRMGQQPVEVDLPRLRHAIVR